MRILRVLFGFFIGRGNAWLWNIFVYILCVVPTFTFVEAVRNIEDPAWTGRFRFGALLLILAFALTVDLVLLASTLIYQGAWKYAVALLIAASLVFGILQAERVYDLRTHTAAYLVISLAMGLFLLHLSLVRLAGAFEKRKAKNLPDRG